ncbi:MAG: phosphatidate cytidylyltransferase [Verrucomicrobiota bacterium]|nr:MAG: phosphatidate cytidylyltransferase [Verrucomicrobiota bacterium]
MIRRTLSTIFLWSLIGAVLAILGTPGGVFLLIFAASLTQYEFYQLVEQMGNRPYKYTATLFGTFFLLHVYAQPIGLSTISSAVAATTFLTVLYSTTITLKQTPEAILKSLIPTLFGFAYIPVLFALPIEFIKNGPLYYSSEIVATLLIIWMIVVIKCADVGGLLVGCLIGKHHIAPAFSPKKTYEGLLGSLIFSIAAGVIFRCCSDHLWPNDFTLTATIIIAAILSFFSLISDLVESGLKRLANVKDSGNSIPGIGGIFDLTDSLVLTLPLGVILIKTFVLC